MDKEFNIRPYMSDLSYSEQMRLYTDKTVSDMKPVRHSEFKQPYLFPSYPEMEYWWDWPPWMMIKYPGADFPWLREHAPNMDPFENPCSFVFNADLSDLCWCAGETLCFNVTAFHPIVAVELENPEWHKKDFKVSGVGQMICIAASDEASGDPGINVFMRAMCEGKPTIGSYEGFVVPECWPPSDECCSGSNYNPPEWDDAESAQSINLNSVAVIAIKENEFEATYGLPPYKWSVSGIGFRLAQNKTMGKSNALVTDDTACGMASITVTDRCGNQCSGEVACSAGEWSEINCDEFYQCPADNDASVARSYFHCEGNLGPGKRWELADDCPGAIYNLACTCIFHRTESYAACMTRMNESIYAPNGLIANPCNTVYNTPDYMCTHCGNLLPDNLSECNAMWDEDLFRFTFLKIGIQEWGCET